MGKQFSQDKIGRLKMKMHDNDNIIRFLPPMSFNKNFMYNFVEAAMPCASLGIVETEGQKKGFLAIKTEEPLSEFDIQNGFDLGSQLMGKGNTIGLHLILNFGPSDIYDVVLNLSAPVTRQVMELWEDTKDYFFLAFTDSSFTAFRQTVGNDWFYYDYFSKMREADNTVLEYKELAKLVQKTSLHGKYIGTIFQDRVEFLSIDEKFEVKGGFN